MLNGITTRLEHYMNLLGTRQKLVASNVANLDTPGYQTKDIDFQFEFMSLVGKPGGPDVKPNIVEVEGLKTKQDGNNVSLDRETRLMSENALRFSLASQLVRSEIRQLRTAIQDGR